MSRISYRVKDLNDGTFLNNDHSDWDPHTFTSFATLEEAKNAVKDWGGSGCKLVIVKVTTKPVPTTNGRDWNWALKQLHKGKKVRRLSWDDRDSISYAESGGLVWDHDGAHFGTATVPTAKSKDWVLA